MNKKNRLIVAVIFSVLVAVMAFWPGGQDEAIAAKPKTVTICHGAGKVGYEKFMTMEVPATAERAHLAHGDKSGSCP